MKSVSFIVPVYNSSKCIEKCINSIINLNFKIYEIIIIDDASNDNSLEIIKRIISKNYSISIHLYINSTNKGVSYTRNIGIEKSKYEYISFVDSDDYFVEGIRFSETSTDNDVDIYVYSFLQNNIIIKVEECSVSINKNGIEIINNYFNNPIGNSIFTYVWSKFYRKEFITKFNIIFDIEKKIHEDIIFNINSFYHSENIKYIDEKIYNYTNLKHNYNFNMENKFIFLDIYEAGKKLIPNLSKFENIFVTTFVCKNLILVAKSNNFLDIYSILSSYYKIYNRILVDKINNKILRLIFHKVMVKLPLVSCLILYIYYL